MKEDVCSLYKIKKCILSNGKICQNDIGNPSDCEYLQCLEKLQMLLAFNPELKNIFKNPNDNKMIIDFLAELSDKISQIGIITLTYKSYKNSAEKYDGIPKTGQRKIEILAEESFAILNKIPLIESNKDIINKIKDCISQIKHIVDTHKMWRGGIKEDSYQGIPDFHQKKIEKFVNDALILIK